MKAVLVPDREARMAILAHRIAHRNITAGAEPLVDAERAEQLVGPGVGRALDVLDREALAIAHSALATSRKLAIHIAIIGSGTPRRSAISAVSKRRAPQRDRLGIDLQMIAIGCHHSASSVPPPGSCAAVPCRRRSTAQRPADRREHGAGAGADHVDLAFVEHHDVGPKAQPLPAPDRARTPPPCGRANFIRSAL
jgi:hypothetical protein